MVVSPRKAKPGGYLLAPPAPAALGLPMPPWGGFALGTVWRHTTLVDLCSSGGQAGRGGWAPRAPGTISPLTPRPDTAHVPGSATGPC